MQILFYALWLLLALLFLLTVVPIRIICHADTAQTKGDVKIAVRVLGIKFSVFPKKKRLPDIKKFRHGALRKMLLKKQRKEEKERRKKAKRAVKHKGGAADGNKEAPKRDIVHIIKLATALTKTLFASLGKYLRVDIKYFDIVCATPDVADTAILYGAAYAAMEAFWGTVQGARPLSRVKKSDISIYADFLSEKPSLRAELVFSIAPWQIALLLIRGGAAALSVENARRKNENETEKQARLQREASARADIIKELKK